MTRQTHPYFLLLTALTALLAGACLWPGLGGDFVFDDRPNILQNEALRLIRWGDDSILYAIYSFQAGGGSRALSMLTLALDFWRAGPDPATFKTTNVAIHAVTTVALAFFLRRLATMAGYEPKAASVGALVVTALWALHPLQVSSVLYVVQRMQTLVTLFMVLAMWAYLGMRRAQLQDRSGFRDGLLVALFFVLGLASKEDAALLPAYLLALELTVLQFSASQPRVAAFWKRGYAIGVVGGAALFALVVVPHYWDWSSLPGRNFSSWERVLTQGRVLVMYLGQIIWPTPNRLPFYYDDFVVSRSAWDPVSTVPAWLLVGALMSWAWIWRHKRPLFAFGIMLFFAGHAITSNVINLELVFEHRNHLPMIGILIAITDLSRALYKRVGGRLPALGVLVAVALLAEGIATAHRAYTWGDRLRFGREMVRIAPQSERAWMALGSAYIDESGFDPKNPWFARAVSVNEAGGRITHSAVMLSNVVIYKTIRGDVSPADWARLHSQLPSMTMNVQNRSIALILLSNVQKGMKLDTEGVIQTWEIMLPLTEFAPDFYLHAGAFIHNNADRPERAMAFFRHVVSNAPSNAPAIDKFIADLDGAGRGDWARELRRLRNKSLQAKQETP